jgi:hypothetical protein
MKYLEAWTRESRQPEGVYQFDYRTRIASEFVVRIVQGLGGMTVRALGNA